MSYPCIDGWRVRLPGTLHSVVYVDRACPGAALVPSESLVADEAEALARVAGATEAWPVGLNPRRDLAEQLDSRVAAQRSAARAMGRPDAAPSPAPAPTRVYTGD